MIDYTYVYLGLKKNRIEFYVSDLERVERERCEKEIEI